MQTLIAAFDDRPSAQRAVDRLITNGFDPGAVHLQAGYEPDHAAAAEHKMEAADYESGFSSRVAVFFGNLFGDTGAPGAVDHAGARSQVASDAAAANGAGSYGLYAEAVRQGHSVVVVDTIINSDFEHVELLMYENGAIDVEERSAAWPRQLRTDSGLDVSADDADELQAGNRGPVPGRRGVQMVRDRMQNKL